jgi:hypothetical protein
MINILSYRLVELEVSPDELHVPTPRMPTFQEVHMAPNRQLLHVKQDPRLYDHLHYAAVVALSNCSEPSAIHLSRMDPAWDVGSEQPFKNEFSVVMRPSRMASDYALFGVVPNDKDSPSSRIKLRVSPKTGAPVPINIVSLSLDYPDSSLQGKTLLVEDVRTDESAFDVLGEISGAVATSSVAIVCPRPSTATGKPVATTMDYQKDAAWSTDTPLLLDDTPYIYPPHVPSASPLAGPSSLCSSNTNSSPPAVKTRSQRRKSIAEQAALDPKQPNATQLEIRSDRLSAECTSILVQVSPPFFRWHATNVIINSSVGLN